ncbi:hypothetical protein [Rhizobium leguminosarum]|uniref:hypothetical protein n=1 Tax=Rhizobium leguminosarum TaxID=384 RepID=UPI001C981986|nr:hypothetical protein [Rhizobium leguminosarum]MBY5318218.1 hypothetical protein [Rhizobium leguminosarum]
MPRMAKPENSAKRLRTEKWREKQEEACRPESAHVDVALAAAVAALLRQQEERRSVSPDLSTIVRTASAILQDRGFDAKAGSRKLMERLRFRRDLQPLQALVAPAKLVTRGSASE